MDAESASGAHVLVVDDDDAMCAFLAQGLGTLGFEVQTRLSASAALESLDRAEVDVVVTDLRMRGMGGHELCREIVARHPDVAVIVLTAFGTYETAVDAIRAGAYDFHSKPVDLDTLALAIGRAAERRRLRSEVRRLQQKLDHAHGGGELVGESAAMQKVYGLLERIEGSDASVLVTGESGTGKEIVARTLHRRGRRARGPFVALNCAAVPEHLLEAELFGYERGAFTDAKTARTGLFIEAHRGTLLLDEIGDMPPALQAKILRALQERSARPIGGRREVPFDVRIIAATNRDLEAMIEQGRFREDLFYRINVVQVSLPPLRARGVDVLLLAQHFLRILGERTGKQMIGIDAAAAEALMAYAWPGNVRELQNCIERAVAIGHHDHVTTADLPDRVARHRLHVVSEPDDDAGGDLLTLEEMERRYVLRVLEAVGGSRVLAAKRLGLDRTTLWRKLDRYGVAAAPSSRRP